MKAGFEEVAFIRRLEGQKTDIGKNDTLCVCLVTTTCTIVHVHECQRQVAEM